LEVSVAIKHNNQKECGHTVCKGRGFVLVIYRVYLKSKAQYCESVLCT